jgi:hypothetical protein
MERRPQGKARGMSGAHKESVARMCRFYRLTDVAGNPGLERAFVARGNIAATKHCVPARFGAAKNGSPGSIGIPHSPVNRARPEAGAVGPLC